MLVISRKLGERIILADNVEITVLQIRGKAVRLGVAAPRDIAVNRREVQAGRQKPIPSPVSFPPKT